MLVVHHLDNSRSQRILWLLEELGLPYEVKFYKRHPKTLLAPPELLAIHPLGKAPILTDEDKVIAESGAIIEYILDTYGNDRLRPAAQSKDKILYNYFLHYAEGSIMPNLVLSLIFTQLPKAPMPFFVKPLVRGLADKVKKAFVNPQLKLHFSFLEKHLENHLWFAGDNFSAADIQMGFPVEAGMKRGGGQPHQARLSNFVDRIHARPAYQAALKRGGPFEILS